MAARVTFILGGAGSGKTHWILEDLRRTLAAGGAQRLLWLVPEQATFQAEQALLAGGGCACVTRCEVLSFRSLATRVFERAGLPAREPLTEVGRLLVLSRAYAAAACGFAYLPREGGRARVAQVGRTLMELLRHGHTPESLRHAARAAGDGVLRHKLGDLSVLMEHYLAELAATHQDPDCVLRELVALLDRRRLFEGAGVWVDGFAGLNGQERAVLRALGRQAATLKVSLLVEAQGAAAQDGAAPDHILGPVTQTYRQLAGDFAREGFEVGAPVVLAGAPPRFAAAPDLAHVARHVFRDDAAPWEGSAGALRVTACPTPRREAEHAARQVLELVVERGLRYRDIAIIVRDLAPWHDLLAAHLSELGIPFFIDRRRSLEHHPFVELVRAAGDVLEEDFSTGAMCRLMKTGLAGLEPKDVDALENHVLRTGLHGEMWWDERAPAGVRELIGGDRHADAGTEGWALASHLAGRLVDWRVLAGAPRTGRAWAEALYDLTCRLGAFDTLAAWAERTEADGELEQAQEHRQAVAHFTALLDEVAAASGDEPFTSGEFFAFLETGLAAWDMGLTPQRVDQVLVGAIERSRHPPLRAVILAGFNDGDFPRSVSQETLLADEERAHLAARGFACDGASGDALLEERLLAYIVFTRASEHLWISFSEKNTEGKALFPSTFLADLAALFPGLETGGPGDPLAAAVTPERLVEGRLRRAVEGRDTTRWDAALDMLGALPDHAARVAQALDAARREPMPAVMAWDAPEQFTVAVTELETFAACPFQHFARHRLKLRERDTFELGRLELGVLRHRVLERLGKELIRSGEALWGLGAERRDALLASALEGCIGPRGRAVARNDPLLRYLLDRLDEDLKAFLRVRSELEERGRWRPCAAELPFGDGGELPALRYDLGPHTCAVRGQIDRVDRAEAPDGGAYLMVYDFKGRAAFKLDTVYHGLALQLPLYLRVVREGAAALAGKDGARVAGALVHGMRRSLRAEPRPVERQEKELVKEEKPRGLLLAEGLAHCEPLLFREGGRSEVFCASVKKDGTLGSRRGSDVLDAWELEALNAHVDQKVKDLAAGILAGHAAPSPALHRNVSACARCVYAAVCRFEKHADPGKWRTFEALAAGQVLERLGGAPDGVQLD